MFKHRHLIVKRSENLAELGRESLKRMLEYQPAWAILRRFADWVYWLLDTPRDVHQASCRRAAILHEPAFLAVPELVKAMEQLDNEKFPRLMATGRTPCATSEPCIAARKGSGTRSGTAISPSTDRLYHQLK